MDVVSECQQDVEQLFVLQEFSLHIHVVKLISCGTVVVFCIVSQ